MSRLDNIAVALDTPDWGTFRGWTDLFGPRVGVLKVGLEAFARWGPRAVETARATGAGVFLDLKLHDIPGTVTGAVAAARAMGVDYLTIHAAGGPAMLAAAADAAGDDLTLLAVTVLTHLDAAALAALGLPGTSRERALRWATLADESGIGGAVCSPLEAAALRSALPRPFTLVTPGVRPAAGTVASDDQRRTATPAEALRAGADLLVIGRPLTRAEDPAAALTALAGSLPSRPSRPSRG